MKRALFLAVTAAALLGDASAASAGIFADDMTRCLVRSASADDKTKLVKWVFSALAANPNVASIARVSEADASALTRDAAGIFERLVLVDCRKESVEAIRNEGLGALNQSFEILGQTASRELMSHPAVEAKFEALTTYADESKWEALATEATGRAAKAN